jgi:hypothetical protein
MPPPTSQLRSHGYLAQDSLLSLEQGTLGWQDLNTVHFDGRFCWEYTFFIKKKLSGIFRLLHPAALAGLRLAWQRPAELT